MKSENINSAKKNPSRQDVHLMFDRISGRYDLLNRLLSMRRDVVWRRHMARLLPKQDSLKVLDLATGTGDVLLSFNQHYPGKITGTGLDMSADMLKVAAHKFDAENLNSQFSLVRADACAIPFENHSYDITSIAFGIRNVPDVGLALSEMHRILKPGGKTLILEFSIPTNKLIKTGYLFYFRHILPTVGGLISGDSYAYRYLNQTVETFPYGQKFCSLMKQAGFKTVVEHSLSFGIATIYEGLKA